MTGNVQHWERTASLLLGGGMLLVAARRHGRTRWLATAAATGLLGRGMAGYCPIKAQLANGEASGRRALAESSAVFVEESVTIQAPVDTLYAFWRDPANLPRVLPYLDRVESLGDRRSHWVVRGPIGVTLEWDAEITAEVPLETIAWQSLAGADVACVGAVEFRVLPRGRTQLTVTMRCAPPAGRLGASIAWWFGRSPRTQVREALRQFKQIMEAGEAPTTTGQPTGRRSRLFMLAKAAS